MCRQGIGVGIHGKLMCVALAWPLAAARRRLPAHFAWPTLSPRVAARGGLLSSAEKLTAALAETITAGGDTARQRLAMPYRLP